MCLQKQQKQLRPRNQLVVTAGCGALLGSGDPAAECAPPIKRCYKVSAAMEPATGELILPVTGLCSMASHGNNS